MRARLVSIVFFLPIILSSCSSDPFSNAGSCDLPGSYQKFESGVAVCAGLDSKYKFYFEGTAFEDMYLLGRAEIGALNFDTEDAYTNKAKSLGLTPLYGSTLPEITNDDLARFANGDVRWDGLIEANAKRLTLKAENDIAFEYRYSMLAEYRAGRVSRAVAFEAQEAQMKTVAKLDAAQAIFDEKLAVLRSEIKRIYGVQDTLDVMMFVIVSQKL
jgi:hypothetical protein